MIEGGAHSVGGSDAGAGSHGVAVVVGFAALYLTVFTWLLQQAVAGTPLLG
jgi:hypothetical protein